MSQHPLLILPFLLLPFLGTGQVFPPEFLCVRGDTLFWNPAVNLCGSFQNVEIFKSNSEAGPYVKLATLTDAGVLFFHDPTGDRAFYYLVANHDCPGETLLFSDTLNNIPPLPTVLEKVTVQGPDVLVSWYDNGDPETVGYIVYRSGDQGTMPIDTVFGALSYLDQSAQPDLRSETYYVLAMDQCGNTGTFDISHQTIHLEVTLDFCERNFRLDWKPYVGFQNGTENSQIWLGIAGAPLAYEHQLRPTDTAAYITGIRDNTSYCIAIVAKENGRPVVAQSNVVCMTSDVINPVTLLDLRNASVLENGHIQLDWSYNADADVKQVYLERGTSPTTLQILDSLGNNLTGSGVEQLIDPSAMSSSQPYFYRISIFDECDQTVESSIESTVYLEVSTDITTQHNLVWTPFESMSRTLLHYRICQAKDGESEILLQLNEPTALSYSTSFIDAEEICYRIKAVHTALDGSDTLESISNKVCRLSELLIYIPNAFAPGGTNKIFRPIIAGNRLPENYSLQIYDRWGGQLFESENPDFGWDGYHNGRLLEPGVYLYVIQFTEGDGTSGVRSGTINLID